MSVLTSEKFIIAMFNLIAIMIVGFVPEFEEAATEIITALTAVTLSVIAGGTLSDAFKALPLRVIVESSLDAYEEASGKDIPDNVEKLLSDIAISLQNAVGNQAATSTEPDTVL